MLAAIIDLGYDMTSDTIGAEPPSKAHGTKPRRDQLLAVALKPVG